MDNNTATPLQGEILLVNQLDLVIPTTVAGTLYGVAFTLFCSYVHSLAPQLRDVDRKRQAKFMLGYSTVIMLCGLYSLVANAWTTQTAYIKHPNYPEGPQFYIETTFHSDRTIAVGFACQVAIDILTSAIQVWRVWVIWSATRYAYLATLLPLLSFLTFTGFKLRCMILSITLPFSDVAQRDGKAQLAHAGVQGATTVLCTLLISLYLIFKQWQQRKLIGRGQGSTGYMKVVAMIIESYVLESIWLLIIAIILNQPAGVFFSETVDYIEIIAYLLVQYRVAGGKSYGSQRGRRNISSLHWNHSESDHATTQFRETCEVQSDPQSSTLDAPEASCMA